MHRSAWLLLGLCACSFETGNAVAGANNLETEGSTSTDPDASESTATPATSAGDDNPDAPDPSAPDPSAPDPTGDGGTSAGETNPDDDDSTGDAPNFDPAAPGCPDPLPDEWVLCEDFENVDDPQSYFPRLYGNDIDVEGDGYESNTSLRINHEQGSDWDGLVSMRFGRGGPEHPNVARPNATFEEVWVRFMFRTQEDWPVEGVGDFFDLDSRVADPAWGRAFMARVSSPTWATNLHAGVFSCLFPDFFPCDMENEWTYLQPRGSDQGEAEVFEDDNAESWHCMVVHARVNTPGLADGVLETLVDNDQDAGLYNLDYRGGYDEYGFNAITLPTYFDGDTSEARFRYFDDFVVATVPLECPQ